MFRMDCIFCDYNMRNFISYQKGAVLLFLVVFAFHGCASIPGFKCPTQAGEELPAFPEVYSTNIRINHLKKNYTVEWRLVVSNGREAIEIWADKRHVKYIRDGSQQLLITFNSNSAPTCTVKTIPNVIELVTEDAGPNRILGNISKVFYEEKDDYSKFVISDAGPENSAIVRKWEGCFTNPKINISLSYTGKQWGQAHTSALHKGFQYIVSMDAQVDNDYMTALYSNFNPVMPDASEFQPPENVFCEGYKTKKKPPVMMDYFSYDSEIIVYESSMAIAPIVSHRTVYYDLPARISRTDFYDPLAKDQDLFSPVTAWAVSIIHDFNSGVQYHIDPITGKCQMDTFKVTTGPIIVSPTSDNKMPNGNEFFSLNTSEIAYNGQFLTRGYLADVFTARFNNVTGDSQNGKKIYTWYFSTDRTQVVGKENVEKNVLLRMVTRNEAADGKEGEVEVNFYNFEKGEPSIFMYDITSCYNEKVSKTFVLTFPAKDQLRGSETLLKNHIHLAIKETTGISKQRIFIFEVTFSEEYMFAEFKLLAAPDALVTLKSPSKEITLDEAIAKLKLSVSDEKFSISVPTKDSVLILRPEPNGLNEFAGDRKSNQSGSVYNEGSVIALTIGMLLLGFALGGVTLNLIVSRKFGVSLFQKSNSRDPFTNSLGESSM